MLIHQRAHLGAAEQGDVHQEISLGQAMFRNDARGDSGGASRFMYVAKVSRWERELGCEDIALRTAGDTVGRAEDSPGINNARAGAGRTGEGVRNHHPTLKPIALTTWLATLILPPWEKTRSIFAP